MWYARQIFFLLVPLILHILPYKTNPYASLQSVPFAVKSVEQTLSSLYVLDAVRRASLRDDELRGRVNDFYTHDALTSRLAWRDEEIREEAERAGMALPAIVTPDDENDIDTASPIVAAVRGMVNQWKGTLVGLLQGSTASSPPSQPLDVSQDR